MQSFFSLFAVFNVRGQSIPVENLSFDVAHGDHTGLKPAVYAIEPTHAMLQSNWLACRDRVASNFDGVGKIVRVNHVARLPLLCLLRRFAEILQIWSIEHLGCEIRREANKKARHVVQERARLEFSRMQGFFRLFAVINVRGECIPMKDLSLGASHGDPADLKPAVHTIEPTAAIFEIKWLAR